MNVLTVGVNVLLDKDVGHLGVAPKQLHHVTYCHHWPEKTKEQFLFILSICMVNNCEIVAEEGRRGGSG